MTKVCKGCGVEKSIEDFYRHKGMRDGRLNYCIECVTERVRLHRRDNDHVREAQRTKRTTLDLKQYRLDNPDKYAAHKKVSVAVRNGTLTKKPCSVCGSDDVVAHHEDYTKPLEVEWLCQLHHMRHHHPTPF